MKLPILPGLALLALAGAAVAGPPEIRIASDFEGTTSTPTAYEQVRSHAPEAAADVLRSVQRASSDVHLACAADQGTFCADAKTSFSANRCLERHRKDVGAACRSALSQAAMAWSSPRPDWNAPR